MLNTILYLSTHKVGRQNICDQKQSPGFSVGTLPLSPQKHPGVQPLPDLQKQACIADVRGIFLTVHGDEPAGCWHVQSKAAPATLRSFHTWLEASTQSSEWGNVVKGLRRDTCTRNYSNICELVQKTNQLRCR